MSSSTLSFTLRVASGAYDLSRACAVRAECYGHHMPGWREALGEPDPVDHLPSTVVLLCEDKETGAPIGTARIQTSREQPLLIEESIELPEAIAHHGRAEITRLSSVRGADLLVKIAMWKAVYLYCQASQSRWMVIGARNEALVRQYRRLGFTDIHPRQEMVPLAHAGGLAHRVLALDTYAVERTWRESQHGLYGFFFETFHPDIDLVERERVPARLQALAA